MSDLFKFVGVISQTVSNSYHFKWPRYSVGISKVMKVLQISWLRVFTIQYFSLFSSPGEHKTSLQDQEIFNLRSTCHIALDRCERDSDCRYDGRQEGGINHTLYLSSTDLTWSLSRPAVRTPAAETDACPQWGSSIGRFHNNTASISPSVSASKFDLFWCRDKSPKVFIFMAIPCPFDSAPFPPVIF